MRVLFVLLSMSSLILINSCNIFHGKNDSVKSCKAVIVDKDFDATAYNSEYKINNLSLTDSLLTINITYTGNTKNDEFDLVFNGMYAKSMPPIATLVLIQKENGSKEFTRDLCYDISNIKYKGGKTRVMVRGFNQKIMYSY